LFALRLGGPRLGMCLLGLMLAAPALAQSPPQLIEPMIGTPGKDVVYVPQPVEVVEKMLDVAQVTARDFVIDLGSGDGRNVIAAAKRGARALGVEYNPDLVELSKRNAEAEGVSGKASFVQGDMFAADISQATVLVLFLIPANLHKLADKFYDMKPGTRIVSNTYEIGGGWEPDDSDRLKLCATWCGAHLYIVPAKVAGTWRLPDGELTLEQSFQNVWGTYQTSGISVPISGLLRGEEILFSINSVEYSGRVTGDAMKGVAKGRTLGEWTARRARE
ncbi:MAG TPA: methyltransferase domain-containing protein, partial [Burkholderiales bacterium]|nr:methyltransferase domain-containing protein [Burkholderiales bacterium]